MGDNLKVSLTLPRVVAEKLRAICHARAQTASDVVAKWIVNEGVEKRGPRPRSFVDELADLIAGKGRDT